MSLKAVHLVFVIAATLLAFGLGAAHLVSYRSHGGGLALGLGLAWLTAGVALVFYGRRILRKLRHVSYL